jgi:hypothetical protein
MKKLTKLLIVVMLCITAGAVNAQEEWISLFNGKNLNGWFAYGNATWSVQDGAIVGEDAAGHLYSYPQATDFELKGMFRVSGERNPNSGVYFRAHPPANLNGFPRGYEAQIDNHSEAFTGWLWKPGKPTGPATKLLTKDGEWFSYRIRAVGTKIQFWVKDELVMTYEDDEYTSGHFAIQMHHPGMKVEAKDLYYRVLNK